ncbi:MAG: riboflavin biosynthesis protein RibF [bacterium JZ-2024 1]
MKFVWAVGVFDGFHRGHQALVERARQMARDLHARAGVLTFHPHPREILFGTRVPMIVTLNERVRLLSNAGVARVWTVEFTPAFSRILPEDFLRQYFVTLSRTRGIIVGEDFTFGYGGRRNRRLLRQFSAGNRIVLEIFPWVRDQGRKISSQRIRQLIRRGDMEAAARLLGRPYGFTASVVRGQGRGRAIGFPTLNFLPDPALVLPRFGVYIVATIHQGKVLPGIANLGIRPTFEEKSAPVLEVYIPGAHLQTRAGTTFEIRFLRHIRPERRFASASALVRQIHKDLAFFSNFVHTHLWKQYGEPASF